MKKIQGEAGGRAEAETLSGPGDEMSLYDEERDAVHILNPTAKRIYELHKEGRKASEIEAALRMEFAAGPEDDIAGDVRRVLSEIERKNIR